jgi:hypothetical protein
VRIELRGACVIEAGDRLVLREVGRGATVAGGPVLDPAPPARPANVDVAFMKQLSIALAQEYKQ